MNSGNTNLLKSVILGGLYPRLAKVHLPKWAIKFDKVQAGTVQRDNSAKDFKMYDVTSDTRVFLHPGSILFEESAWKSRFVVYFQKQMTSKVFLRDVTEVRCDLRSDHGSGALRYVRFHCMLCYSLEVQCL